MAFKKREYKYWYKFFHHLVFKNGCNPYLLANSFQKDLIEDEEYEGAKAANDVFTEWRNQYNLSESEVEKYLTDFYKNHPAYGGKPNFPILKHPGI